MRSRDEFFYMYMRWVGGCSEESDEGGGVYMIWKFETSE